MTSHEACIERLAALCERFRIDSLRPRLSACEAFLADAGVVDVAVLGQFKAGKSSFLNSLVGRDLLPVDVLPATAVVTRIGHGPVDRVLVRHLSGAREEIPLERLADYVTERENPENVKQAAMVEVELSSLSSYRGIRFVDTPGLGSVFAHNTRVSLSWLPRVGGALVAVSVNHPLSEQDLKLLGEVSRHTPEVTILLTKADLVTEGEVSSVAGFTREQVAKHAGMEPRILPYSVRPGFPHLRKAVEGFLVRHFVERHEERYGEIVGHKIRALFEDCREYLLLARAAANAAEKARLDLREALSRERRGVGTVKSEVLLFARDAKSRVRTAAGERFHVSHAEVTERLRKELGTAMKGWRGNLAKTTRAFEEWLKEATIEELSRLSGRGEGHLAEFLLEARGSLERAVRAFQDRLAGEIELALGVPFRGARFDAEIAEPARPDVRVAPAFETHFELLWFLIPMWLVRPLVARHFLRRVPWEVEKNLSRLASQWAEAFNTLIDGLVRQTLEFMENELATVERMAAAAGPTGREAVREALEELGGLDPGVS